MENKNTVSFEDLKKELLDKAKNKYACISEYKRAVASKDQAELLKVIYDNFGWCAEHEVISNEYFSKFDAAILLASGCANTGLENTGLANSGNWNSGDRNSGDSNSGDSNSGDWNSGDRNSGPNKRSMGKRLGQLVRREQKGVHIT